MVNLEEIGDNLEGYRCIDHVNLRMVIRANTSGDIWQHESSGLTQAAFTESGNLYSH